MQNTTTTTSSFRAFIKQKLSSIFNNGITLWSLFSSTELWYNELPSEQYYVDKWFLKDIYENPEINF